MVGVRVLSVFGSLVFGSLLLASQAHAEEVSGMIETEDSRIVILPAPAPVGTTVTTPEGWYRVEYAPEDEPEDTGSFGIIPKEEPSAQRLIEPPEEQAPRPRAPPLLADLQLQPECAELAETYAKRLLVLSGIEIEHPLELLALLGRATLSPHARTSIFGSQLGGPLLPLDPLSPLAWDFTLQQIARDLSSCLRDGS